MSQETEPACYGVWREYRQKLFKHFAATHDLHLLESEMVDIEQIVFQHPDLHALRENYSKVSHDMAAYHQKFGPLPL